MAALLSDAARDLDALGSPHVAEPIQASVQAVASIPIVAAVTGTSDSWKLLRDRLDIILKWGDAIAEVCYVLAPLQNVFSLPQIFSRKRQLQRVQDIGLLTRCDYNTEAGRKFRRPLSEDSQELATFF